MKQMSFVDLYFFVKELSVLEQQRIDSFFFDEGIFYIKVYVKGKGHFFLTNKVSKYIYLGDKKEESSHPVNFVQYLRKYLKNAYISRIRQIESERILELLIEKKDGDDLIKYYLIIELFANGNVVVCDENYNIKNSLEKRKFKDRAILVNEKYELPPQKEISLFDFDEKLFQKMLLESGLSCVKFLAIKFGIGGKFAEEVCFLSRIDKNKFAKDLNDEDVKVLSLVLKDLVSKKTDACGVYDSKGVLVDFLPFIFESLDGSSLKQFSSFNEVLKEYFSNFLDEKDKREEQFKKELVKLQDRLSKQKLQKEDILRDYEIYNNLGNKIFENYTLVEDLLNSMNKSAKEKGWDYVEEVIKSNEELSKIIKKINCKDNEIVLDL